MQIPKVRNLFALALLVVFLPRLGAEDRRSIPMDLYLIIDGSEAFKNSKADAVAWVNENVVDRLLLEGDRISIWAAGDTPELIFSGAITSSGDYQAIKDKLINQTPTGKSADFPGALRNVESGVSATARDRLPYTMLVKASAGGLDSALTGDTQDLLRWFRSEKYDQWQVLVVAPDIGRKVNQAALGYMNSQQGR